MRWTAPFFYLWAFPNTALGLIPLPIVWLQGGTIQIVNGVVEIAGGIVTRILNIGWGGVKPRAMTLGHVVWAIDQQSLINTRVHERVHVRQYERWGPLFLPAYLGCSLLIRLRGGDAYFDNPFEKEAYAISDAR